MWSPRFLKARRAGLPAAHRWARRPQLESLEDRLVLSKVPPGAVLSVSNPLSALTGLTLHASDSTTTTVNSSANPAFFGQAVTFTATLSTLSLVAGQPTGKVQFVIDNSNAGAPVAVTTSGQLTTATFTTALLGVGSHTVAASYVGDSHFASSSGILKTSQVINPASTAMAVVSSGTPSVFGQGVTFTAIVSVNTPGSSAAATPTGTVTFYDGATSIGQGALSSAGGVTTTAFTTANLAFGTHPITASYTGDGNFTSSAGLLAGGQIVNQANTSTAVLSSPSSLVFGQSVTFTAVVTINAPGSAALANPTGSVTFYDGATSIGQGTLSTAGGVTSATLTTALLKVGTHTISASYTGDGNFAGSAGTLPNGQLVSSAGTSTVLFSNFLSAVFGQSVTFTAIVSVTAPGSIAAGTPSGTVTFYDGATSIGQGTLSSANGSYTAIFSTATLGIGAHTITATYNGDGNFAPSNNTLAQTVGQAATATAVTSTSNPSVSGQGITFTAVVTASSPGSTAAANATGTVSFYDGSTSLGQGTLTTSGGVTTASFSLATLAVGTHTITASYVGDGNFQGSGGVLTNGQLVNQAGTSVAIAASTNTSVFGQSVSFTATVTVSSPGSTAVASPTGIVTFFDGSMSVGRGTLTTTGGTTTAAFSLAALGVGNHTITASYSGDASFLSSSSSASQTVNKASTSTAVVTSVSPAAFGQGVTFTATVTVTVPGSMVVANPGGTVSFYDGSTSIGQGPLTSNGGLLTAAYSTSALAVGTHPITASYSGDGNFTSSAGTLSAGQTVNKAGTSTAVVSSQSSTVFGQGVTFTATIMVTGPGSTAVVPPSGTVSFYDGSTSIGQGNLTTANGVTTANFTTQALSVNTHAISATYAGDGNFVASNGSLSGGQLVSKAATSALLVSLTNPSLFGQAVTFTATIAVNSPGSTAVASPSGAVTFYEGTTSLGQGTLTTAGGITTASFSTATRTVGNHSLTATYSGDGNFLGSSSTALTQTVNKASTSTAVVASANPSVFGQNVSFTATVTVTGPGSTAVASPTGTVVFSDGSTILGQGTLTTSGGVTTATYSTAQLGVATHSIAASYNGDSNFTSSAGSLSGGQVVNKASTSTAAVSSVNSSVFGQTVSFTATITVNGPGSTLVATPSGTVSFYDGSTSIGQGNLATANGVTTASFSTASLAVSTHTITASYSGDSRFASSSTSFPQTVNKASTSAQVTSSLNPSVFGQTVNFSATISVVAPGAGIPTGTVQFQLDGSNVGNPVSVTTSGGLTTATFSTATLAVGGHTITALYSGDGSFAASNGSLAGGQSVKPNGIVASLNSDTGVLSVSGDTGNNAITIRQTTPGVLHIAGDAVPAPGVPTKVNGTDSADFSAIRAINVQFLNGNNKLTVTGFNLTGDLNIMAGAGSDTFTLDTITANQISVAASGADFVTVTHVTAQSQLGISVGPGSRSVAVQSSTCLDLTIQAHSARGDNLLFDIEQVQVTDIRAGGLTLNDSSGNGSDTVILSNLRIAEGLAVTLGGGVNTLTADHVTALFGFIDGGHPNSGLNNYDDAGNNNGYYVYDFLGY